jgi:hypothetical protein
LACFQSGVAQLRRYAAPHANHLRPARGRGCVRGHTTPEACRDGPLPTVQANPSRGDTYTPEVAATVHAVMTELGFSNP